MSNSYVIKSYPYERHPKMKIKIFLSTLLLSFQTLIAEPTLEDQVKAAKNPDYYIHVVMET